MPKHPPLTQAPAAPAREPFTAPVVEDLGKLQTLTQLFGGTVGLVEESEPHFA